MKRITRYLVSSIIFRTIRRIGLYLFVYLGLIAVFFYAIMMPGNCFNLSFSEKPPHCIDFSFTENPCIKSSSCHHNEFDSEFACFLREDWALLSAIPKVLMPEV